MSKMQATRDGFGEALLNLGLKNKKVVVLSANMAESTRASDFAEKFPDRYFEAGVAEQNMAGLGAGLALSGKIPFITSFGAFSPGINWGQIRIGICYNHANVKIASTHCGISVGADGAGHQMLEDIAIMRVLPNMTVLAPADAKEAKLATYAAAAHKGPVFLRLGREPVENIIKYDKFEIGKIHPITSGKDYALLSTGSMLSPALDASKNLAKHNINVSVYHCPTIKPIDKAELLKISSNYKKIFTIEEHQSTAGFGSTITEIISEKLPKPVIKIGIDDTFGESGKPQDLFSKYKIDSNSIADIVKTNL